MAARLNALALIAVLSLAVGCGGNKDLVPVSGKVTFNGGPPPADGFLNFVPVERVAGKPSRPARATFLTDGAYEATSFTEGDGIRPGSYTVAVTCNKGEIDYSKK